MVEIFWFIFNFDLLNEQDAEDYWSGKRCWSTIGSPFVGRLVILSSPRKWYVYFFEYYRGRYWGINCLYIVLCWPENLRYTAFIAKTRNQLVVLLFYLHQFHVNPNKELHRTFQWATGSKTQNVAVGWRYRLTKKTRFITCFPMPHCRFFSAFPFPKASLDAVQEWMSKIPGITTQTALKKKR